MNEEEKLRLIREGKLRPTAALFVNRDPFRERCPTCESPGSLEAKPFIDCSKFQLDPPPKGRSFELTQEEEARLRAKIEANPEMSHDAFMELMRQADAEHMANK